MTSAIDNLKPAKLNSEYTILQTCATCSYVNISISNSNGLIVTNVEMIDNGSGTWTYDITPMTLGRYDITGQGDLGGVDTSFATYFEVTGSGLTGTLGFYILILILSLGIIVMGFYMQDATIIILGSFGLSFIGLWILFNGIDGLKDPVYTWAIGLIILCLSAYLLFRASYEFINDN
jgi:hypothetical protein